jgi:hypothetical protein
MHVHFLKYIIQIDSILIYISMCIDRYSQVSITWMRVKIASFSADSGLLPVLSTTPNMARMNGPEETEAMEMAMGISGPIGYSAMVFMNSAGNWPGRKIDSDSGYKKKDAWRLAQAVILFLATYLMSSGPILVFF